MTTDLVPTEFMPAGIALRDPQDILREAAERARALAKVVEETKGYTQIGEGKHLRVESWITVGQFFGCSARVTHTEEVTYGGVLGFKAHARVTHDATSIVLSEADAICMQDEKNWEDKPLHQLMSMAETRAISKVLATKFRWVVVLGGFAPTPAEEMGSGTDRKPRHVAGPKLPFGEFKGKLITDETVTIKGLQDMHKVMTEAIARPDNKWKAQNQTLKEAIEAELAKRAKDNPPPEEETPTIPDHQWADLIIYWEEEQAKAFGQACDVFEIQSVEDVSTSDRIAFRDTVQSFIKGKKK